MSSKLPARHPESAAERHREEIRTSTHTRSPSPGRALLPGNNETRVLFTNYCLFFLNIC